MFLDGQRTLKSITAKSGQFTKLVDLPVIGWPLLGLAVGPSPPQVFVDRNVAQTY